MSEINPYIRVLVLREVADFSFPGGFHRREELIPFIVKAVENRLSSAGTRIDITNVSDFSSALFDEFFQAGAFAQEVKKFAGTYYKFQKKRYDDFRNKALEQDDIHLSAERIGQRFFADAFAGYLGEQNPDERELAAHNDIQVPASDRIVTIGDNGAELIAEIDNFKEAIRSDNDPEKKLEGRRDRLESELSASQELLKSRTFRVKALSALILPVLYFIAKEFAGGIIGQKAVELLALVQPLLGL